MRLLITLVLAAGVVGFVLWRGSRTMVSEEQLVGYQQADKPLETPMNGGLDTRFAMLSAWQANQIPLMSRMDTPMGSENGALVYNAQKFWEMNEKRGGHHAGDDLNGIGGMNTDLGDPVYAAGDGLVVYAGEPAFGWGNMVILAHRDDGGKPIRTMYAHLDEIKVSWGVLVFRGDVVGTAGTGNDNYPAHLHFELSITDGIPIGGGYLKEPLVRLDPASFIEERHDAGPDGISSAPLRYVKLYEDEPWTSLDIKGGEKMFDLRD